MSKLYTISELADQIQKDKEEGLVVVTINGCFDILSVPHIRFLQEGKTQGDKLYVGLNSDVSTRSLKGEKRPIVPQAERAEMLCALSCTDGVFIFDDLDPRQWLTVLRPDVHVNGAEYTEDCIEAGTVKEIGARLHLKNRTEKIQSTSDYVQTIIERYSVKP